MDPRPPRNDTEALHALESPCSSRLHAIQIQALVRPTSEHRPLLHNASSGGRRLLMVILKMVKM